MPQGPGWALATLLFVSVAVAACLLCRALARSRRARRREFELVAQQRDRALARAARERDSLIENLAHDIRTPLTSLRGYLETLGMHFAAGSESDRIRFLRAAMRQADRLDDLVRELFELVRLEGERVRLDLEPIALAELVLDVVQDIAAGAEGCAIELVPDPGTEAVRIVGDMKLIERVIANLVENALRNSPRGAGITIRLMDGIGCLVLEVCDTGRGMGREGMAHVFDRYERMDASGRVAGSGLRLAIVKRIVDLHGGRILVDSEVGVGTRFSVQLPLTGPWDPTADG